MTKFCFSFFLFFFIWAHSIVYMYESLTVVLVRNNSILQEAVYQPITFPNFKLCIPTKICKVTTVVF